MTSRRKLIAQGVTRIVVFPLPANENPHLPPPDLQDYGAHPSLIFDDRFSRGKRPHESSRGRVRVGGFKLHGRQVSQT